MSYFDNAKSVTFAGKTVKKLQLAGKTIWELFTKTFTNLVPTSIDETGAVYNGTGYAINSRLASGGTVKSGTNGTVTGFIKVKPGDVVRFASKGIIINWPISNATNCIHYYGTAKTTIGYFMGNGSVSGICTTANSVATEEEYRKKYRITVPDNANIEWIRVGVYGPNGSAGADLIVTVNEEIV